MPDHNININIKDLTSSTGGRPQLRPGRAAATASAIDPKEFKELNKKVKELEQTTKAGSVALQRLLEKLISLFTKAQQKTGAVTPNDIKRVSKEIVDENFKSIEKILKQQLDEAKRGVKGQASAKDIESAVNKGLDAVADSVADKMAKKLGVSLGKSQQDLRKEVRTAIRSAGQPLVRTATGGAETVGNVKKLSGDVLKLSREVGHLIKVIESLRKSGGGVGLNEFNELVGAGKRVANVYKEGEQSFKDLTYSVKELRGATAEAKKELASMVKNAEAKFTNMAKKATQAFEKDRTQITQDIVGSINRIIQASSLKDTELAKAVQKLEGKIGDISKLTTEFKIFSNELGKLTKGGQFNAEDLKKVANQLGVVVNELKKVPDKFSMGAGGLPPEFKNYEKAAKTFTDILAKLESATVEVKTTIEAETGKFQKQIEDAAAGAKAVVPVQADTRKAEKDISGIPSKTPVVISPEVARRALNSAGEAIYKAVSDSIEAAAAEGMKSIAGQTPAEIKTAVRVFLEENSLQKVKDMLNVVAKEVDLSEALRQLDEYTSKAQRIPLGQKIEKVKRDSKEAGKNLEEGFSRAKQQVQDIARHVESMKRGSGTGMARQLPGQTAIDRIRRPAITTTRPTVVQPSAEGMVPSLSAYNAQINKSMEQSVKALSRSLYKLQNDLVSKLTKTFKESESGWDVVREAGQTGVDIFKRMDKEWAIQIADVARMRRNLGYMANQGSPKGVLEATIQRRINDAFPSAPSQQAVNIGKWLKGATERQIKDLDDAIKVRFEDVLMSLKDKVAGKEIDEKLMKEIERSFGQDLPEVYKATYGRSAAIKSLEKGPSPMLRTVAIPAAKITEQGVPTFETAHGAQRAVPRFAKYISGLETIYTQLERSNILDRSKKYSEQIKAVGTRPTGIALDKAEDLARSMVSDLISSGSQEIKRSVAEQFRAAATTKGAEIGKLRGGGPEIQRQVEMLQNKVTAAFKTFGTLEEGQKTAENFLKAMEQAGVSAYDMVKSLDKIEFENVYDVYNRILEGSGNVTPIKTLGKEPYYDRSIREFEKAINQLEGMFPLVEPGRPRRAMHQANVLNLQARTSTVFGEQERLGPQETKDLIKDLNVRLKELTDEMKALEGTKYKADRGLPEDIKVISSLGIPEAQAGNVEEYRAKQFGEGTKYLSTLNSTMLKMYTDTLAELSPLGPQFQQIGRNIASTTNAMRGAGAEFPTLRSARERETIQSGVYGTGGYGFNVVAELRNTASTFEDQILVSGKLADAMTQIVRTKIFAGGEQATKILAGDMKKLGDSVEMAAKEIQKVLGVPVKFSTRADEALIKEVSDKIAVVRGESVEVQQAKIAETFLNYFGRKFTTRFGSKGVSITPAAGRSDLAAAFQQLAEGKKAKVLTKEEQQKAGLGAALLPKSMGQLAAEILMQQAEEFKKAGRASDKAKLDEAAKALVESGNKFMLDLFKDPNFVIPAEAKKAQEDFKKYAEAMKLAFNIDALPDMKGIEQLKDKYAKAMGEQAKFFEEVPIDIRISSYGAAKRGLQTEFLETIIGNIADVGKGGATTLRNVLSSGTYKDLLGGKGQAGKLSAYSEALGFKGAAKSPDEIVADMMGSKYKMAMEEIEKRGRGEQFDTKLVEEYEKNMRAAILESVSSYYSEIVDETGKQRLSLVGPKFVEIVEEPMATAEWTLGQIEKGIKGERLNLPAYASYAAIFGEGSALMKEIQGSITENAKKHWEYLKALEVLNDENSKLLESLTNNLPKIDISKFEAFEGSTGTFEPRKMKNAMGEIITNMNSFQDTVLDISKYPSAFLAELPTGRMSQTGQIEKQPFYVPGALARGTYEEPLLPGQRGMDVVARRLVHVFNMAKDLETAMSNPEEFMESDEIRKRLPAIMADQVKDFWMKVRKGVQGPEAEQAIADAKALIERWFGVLSGERRVDPDIAYGSKMTEQEYIADFLKRQVGSIGKAKPGGGVKTELEAYATTLSQLSDLIVGPKKESATTETAKKRLKGYTLLQRSIDEGTSSQLAKTVGVNVSQEFIDKKVDNLERAKIEYYNSLAEAATGKAGSVEEVLFSRKIPGVMGKATTAVVDRTMELKKVSVDLQKLGYEMGMAFDDEVEAINRIAEEHAKTLGIDKKFRSGKSGLSKAGVPILRQHELGVPIEMAKKVPVDFMKKYTTGGELKTAPEKISGTLFNMLDYIEKLEANLPDLDPAKAKEIKNYIENELVPYIESVRYPFTGISSVQPYRAKLIKDPKAQATLVAPGAPELDMKALGDVIDRLRDKSDTLIAQREGMRARGEDAAADELTSQIDKLNTAISNLLPKYVALQQKLDFDGDQIEIHAARTLEARKEIAQHLQRLKSFKTTTSDIFRDLFTSEGITPSTGKYTIAESSKAFEKKFPYERGFEFLKGPFLEEQVRNLDISKVVEVLGKRRKTDPAKVIENVLRDIVSSQEAMGQIAEALRKTPQSGEMSPQDAASAMEALNMALEGNADVTQKMAEEALRNALFIEKYQDAIEAQLFKVHTGADTEALYRLTRLSEFRTGFGPGRTGRQGQYNVSEKFAARNPASLKGVLGVDPAEEFQTMMNEVLRFAIQKGMDVKHAGDIPVAGEIVRYIASGKEGVEQLWTQITDENDKTFSELRDLMAASESAIKANAGRFSTEDLRKTLMDLYEARGLDTRNIGGNRKQIVDSLVEQLGLKGFLTELSNIVYEEAIEGAVKDAESWTPQKRTKMGVKGDIREWATAQVNQQLKEGGINIRDLITSPQSPLYMMRVSGATPKKQLGRFQSQFGDVPVPQFDFRTMSNKEQKQFIDKYKAAKATAFNLQKELQLISQSTQGGAYSDMIQSTARVLAEEQEYIEKLLNDINNLNYNINEMAKKPLTERVTDEAIGGLPGQLKGFLGDRRKLEEFSKKAGVPMMTEMEEQRLVDELLPDFSKMARTVAKETDNKSAEFVKNLTDEYLRRAKALVQMDRALKSAEVRPNAGVFLEQFIPQAKATGPATTDFNEMQRIKFQQHRDRIIQERLAKEGITGEVPAGAAGGPGGGAPSRFPVGPGMGMGKGPVDVRIVDIIEGVSIGVAGMDTAAKFTKAATAAKLKTQKQELDPYFSEVLTGEYGRRSDLFKKINPQYHKGQASMLERMTASSISAGAGFGKEMQDAPTKEEVERYLSDEGKMFQAQVDAIVKNIIRPKEDFPPHVKALGELGTAIHEKVQKQMERKRQLEGQRKDYEKYEEIVPDYSIDVPEEGGKIAFGGIADIVRRASEKDPTKVTSVGDIKTVSGKLKSEVERAIKETGSNKLQDIINNVGINTRVKLEEAASQINAYLGSYKEAGELAEDAQGEILFYENIKGGDDDPAQVMIGGFDPKRFERDVKAVKEARIKARKLVEENKKKIEAGEKVKPMYIGTTSAREQMVERQKELENLSEERKATDEEIQEFIDLQKDHYKRVLESMRLRGTGGPAASTQKIDPAKDAEKIREELRRQRKAAEFADPENLNKYLGKVDVAAGEGLKSVLENLKNMQSQSKIFMQGLGFDVNEMMKTLPKDIQTSLIDVKEGKAIAADLMEAIDRFNEMTVDPKDRIAGKKIIDVWKLYRVARGDFLLKRADAALEDLKSFEQLPEGEREFRKEAEAYGKFESSVQKTQEFIKRGLGKKTDIHSFDKRFLFPELAMGAGVYQTPQQIARSAGGPLGEDETLIGAFKTLTRDLGEGKEMRAPLAKVREVMGILTQMSPEVSELLSDSEKLSRIGPKILDMLDVKDVSADLARLRSAVEKYLSFNELEAEQRSNLEAVRKYLKSLENQYMNLGRAIEDTDKKWGQFGLVKVTALMDPEEQVRQHQLNLQRIQKAFETPESAGGAKVGQRFSYAFKVVGDAGEVLKNQLIHFNKYDEVVDSAGNTISKFTQRQSNLIEKMQEGNSTFRNAIRRVVMWGAASRLIYGGVSALRESLDEIADIEMGIAQLRMVMSPLETDFNRMREAAVGFAKEYGVGVTDVLRGMKVFAQQGLAQEEVLDRTKVATLAANVSTLNAKDATEALTAAMKAFKEEGTSAMRFLDSWSNVEARHAITAEDMANAIKKSAAAAKTAGLTFDELNGIVAGIGTVTRQTGKEVGTALRFIARRLFSEKGPKALQALDISTLTPTGENRRAFEILSDLAMRWKDLTNAQKLTTAQAIGGTRQYNALIVAMENWDEVLSSIADSTNSKGSAERRNIEVMKTYQKQLEQTKAAFTELKIEIGDIVLPTFKGGLKALKFLIETVKAIPGPIKAAMVGFTAFMGFLIKGNDIISAITETMAKGESVFKGFGESLKKEISLAGFEVLGLGAGKPEFDFAKTLARPKDFFGKYPEAAKKAQKLGEIYGIDFDVAGRKAGDFESVLGKVFSKLRDWGLAYNDFIASMVQATGSGTEKIGESLMNIGENISIIAGLSAGGAAAGGKIAGGVLRKQAQKRFASQLLGKVLGGVAGGGLGALIIEGLGLGAYFGGKGLGGGKGPKVGPATGLGDLREMASKRGLGPEDVGKIKGLKGFGQFLRKGVGFAGGIAGGSTLILGNIVDELGEGMGALGDKMKEAMATADTGMIKAIAPMAVTIAAMIPTLKALYEHWQKINMTAYNYNQSLEGIRRKQEGELQTVGDLLKQYDQLNRNVKDINRLLSDPKLAQRRIDLGTYEDPLVTLRNMSKDIIDLTNNIARSNANLVVSYDKLGNAILRSTGSIRDMLEEAKRTKTLEVLNTELEALNKYITDLSDPGETENLKSLLKDLTGAVPIFGEALSGAINRSPAALLDEAVETINALQGVKNKYPLSTAIDEDLAAATEALGNYRKNLSSNLNDMEKIYSKIVSPQMLRNLKRSDIEELFQRSDIQRFYELEVRLNPELRFMPGVTAEDLMGRDFMRAVEPALSRVLDVNAEMTEGILKTLNVSPLEKGTEIEPGAYLVTFYDKMAKTASIAGQQARLSLEEDGEGFYKWYITYYDTLEQRISKMEFTPDLQNLAKSVFPLDQMKDLLTEDFALFDRFLTGASAGITGLDPKKFKKGFDLGERFFGQLPTTTLLQSDFGFTPFGGVGPVEFMKEFPSDIQKYLIDPMEDFTKNVETFGKEATEGLTSVSIAATQAAEINELINRIQNNQITFQFRSELVEAMKAMADLDLQMKQTNETIRRRADVERMTAGAILPGAMTMPNIELGSLFAQEATAMQRLAARPEGNIQLRRIAELDNSIKTYTNQIEAIAKARANVEQIMSEAASKGITLDRDSLRKIVEDQSGTKLEKGMYDLINVQNNSLEVQKDMAYSLDELVAAGKEGEEGVSKRFLDALNDPKKLSQLINIPTNASDQEKNLTLLEKLLTAREKAAESGDANRIASVERALDSVFKEMVNKLGVGGLKKLAEQGEKFTPKIFANELAQLINIRDAKAFALLGRQVGQTNKDAVEKAAAGIDKVAEFQKEGGIFNTKNVAAITAALGSIALVQRSGSNKAIESLTKQINLFDAQIEKIIKEGGGSRAELSAKDTRRVLELERRRAPVFAQREQQISKSRFYGTTAAVAIPQAAIQAIVDQLGGDVGDAVATQIGLYLAAQGASYVFGDKEVPQSVKNFGEQLKKILAAATEEGASPSKIKEFIGTELFKRAGRKMEEEIEKGTQEAFGMSADEYREYLKGEGSVEFQRKFAAADERDKYVKEKLADFRKQSEIHKEYDDLFRKHQDEMESYVDKFGQIDEGAQEYKDIINRHKKEVNELFRGRVSSSERKKIESAYPAGLQFDDELQKALGKAYAPEMAARTKVIGEALKEAGVTDIDPAKLLATGLLAAGASNYVMGLNDLDRTTQEANAVAEKQSKHFVDLINALSGTELKDFYNQAQTMVEELSKTETRTRVETTGLSALEAKANTLKMLNELQDQAKAELAQRQIQLRNNQFLALIYKAQIENTMRLEKALYDFRDESVSAFYDAQYGPTALANKGLSGFRGDQAFATPVNEMSTQQRMFLEGSKEFRNSMANYVEATRMAAQLTTVAKEQAIEMNKLENTLFIDAGLSESKKDLIKTRYKEVQAELEKTTKTLDYLKDELSAFALAAMTFERFTRTIHTFNDALKDIRANEAIEGLKSFRGYMEGLEKMMGGAHPLARIPISPEEERMGNRVGMDLVWGQANAMQLEEARIRDQLRTAQGEEWQRLSKALRDLPETFRRRIMEYEQGRENEQLRAQLQPFEEQARNLMGLAMSPETTMQDRAAFEGYIGEIAKTMEAAVEPMTKGELKSFLEEQRKQGKITADQYEQAMANVEAGGERQYRGLFGFDLDKLSGMGDIISKHLEKASTFNMKEMEVAITDPLSRRMDTQIQLLAKIAEGLNINLDPLRDALRESSETTQQLAARAEKARQERTRAANEAAKKEPITEGAVASRANQLMGQVKGITEISPYEQVFKGIPEMLAKTKIYRSVQEEEAKPRLGYLGEQLSGEVANLSRSITQNAQRLYENKAEPLKRDIITEGISKFKPIAELQLKAVKERGKRSDYDARALKKLEQEYGFAKGGPSFKDYDETVNGPGGPKGDKIPALLSDGEFIMRTEAAQKIGYDALAYMNNKGELPLPSKGITGIRAGMGGMIKGYAEGGKVGFFTKLFKDIEIAGLKVEEEQSRIDKMVESGKMNKYLGAAANIPMSITQGFFRSLEAIPGLASFGERKYGEYTEDPTKIFKDVNTLQTKAKGFKEALKGGSRQKELLKGVVEKAKERHGSGAISTIFDFLTGVGLAGKTRSAGNLLGAAGDLNFGKTIVPKPRRMIRGTDIVKPMVAKPSVGVQTIQDLAKKYPFMEGRYTAEVVEGLTNLETGTSVSLSARPYTTFNKSGKYGYRGSLPYKPEMSKNRILLHKKMATDVNLKSDMLPEELLLPEHVARHEMLHAMDNELEAIVAFAKEKGIELPSALRDYDTLKGFLREQGEDLNIITPQLGNPMSEYSSKMASSSTEVFAEEGAAALGEKQAASYVQKEIKKLLDSLSEKESLNEIKKITSSPDFEKFRTGRLKRKAAEARAEELGKMLKKNIKKEEEGTLFTTAAGAAMGGRIKKYGMGGMVKRYGMGGRPQMPVSPEEAAEWRKAHRARKAIYENWNTPRESTSATEDLSAGRAAREARGEYLSFTAGPGAGYNVATKTYSDLAEETERRKEAIRAASQAQVESRKDVKSGPRYFTAYGDNINELTRGQFKARDKMGKTAIPADKSMRTGKDWALHTAEAAAARMSPSKNLDYLGAVGPQDIMQGLAGLAGVSVQYLTSGIQKDLELAGYVDPKFNESQAKGQNQLTAGAMPTYRVPGSEIKSKSTPKKRTEAGMPHRIKKFKDYFNKAQTVLGEEPTAARFLKGVQGLISSYYAGEDISSPEFGSRITQLEQMYKSGIHQSYLNKQFPERIKEIQGISTRGLTGAAEWKRRGYSPERSKYMSEQRRKAFIRGRGGWNMGGLIPKLQEGGSIKEGGIAEVHPGEEVVSKLVTDLADKMLNQRQSPKVVAVLEDNKVELKDSMVELRDPTVSLNEDSREVRLATTEIKLEGVTNGTLNIEGFDADTVATKIGASIEKALSGANSVGGERLDEVAKTIDSVQDKLITVKTDIEGRLEMLETPSENSNRINQTLNVTVNDLRTEFDSKLNDVNSRMGTIETSIRRSDNTIDYKLSDLQSKLDRINNSIGVI